MTLNILSTEAEVLQTITNYFVTAARQSIDAKGRFSVALSGGSSPKKLYQLLATTCKEKLDWTKVDFFFGDERNVPQTDSESNYLMAKLALFEPLNISVTQIFAVDTSFEPAVAAEKYAATIRDYFAGEVDSFDLILLGLGDNSHTASLFPYTTVLHEEEPSVKSVFLKDQNVFRITFTAALINLAHKIAFLVYGRGKAIAVHHVIEDSGDIENYPAQLIVPVTGDLQWFMDEAAAENLSDSACR